MCTYCGERLNPSMIDQLKSELKAMMSNASGSGSFSVVGAAVTEITLDVTTSWQTVSAARQKDAGFSPDTFDFLPASGAFNFDLPDSLFAARQPVVSEATPQDLPDIDGGELAAQLMATLFDDGIL